MTYVKSKHLVTVGLGGSVGCHAVDDINACLTLHTKTLGILAILYICIYYIHVLYIYVYMGLL